MPRSSESPPPDLRTYQGPTTSYSPDGRNTMPSQNPPASLIDPLMIDTLAKDFELEPRQRANLHAFVKVSQLYANTPILILIFFLQIGTSDGSLSRADLLTRLYILVSLYSDAAERHRRAEDQGFTDLKELFADLKIRLQGSFTFTKEQSVSVC